MKVGSATLLDKDGVLHVQPSRASLGVVRLLVDENEQVVAEAKYLLATSFEWAGRLRLANAGHLYIDAESGEVDSRS